HLLYAPHDTYCLVSFLHDALPICYAGELLQHLISGGMAVEIVDALEVIQVDQSQPQGLAAAEQGVAPLGFLDEVAAVGQVGEGIDRKSTRLNSSHVKSSYADFCLKNK